MAKNTMLFYLLFPAVACIPPSQEKVEFERLKPVPLSNVEITDGFFHEKLKVLRESTVKACMRKCYETGRIQNFDVASGRKKGKFMGYRFNDSDVYKMIEGAAYLLQVRRDRNLEKAVDTIIEKISAAQGKDGYLNTYYTVVKPGERWRNVAHGHELYCAGHLIEAGIAYFRATGKRKLLDTAIRFADYILETFNDRGLKYPPGHEEIELALVKLARLTGGMKYLRLAEFFVDQRGNGNGHKLYGEYAQDHLPVREQKEAVGHAVRAMYLYSAMADLLMEGVDHGLWSALSSLWKDVTERKMYITGGIGSFGGNEGFTRPYDLPNDSAYCESCAAIGLAFWAERMFLLTGDMKYGNVLERVLYNGLLSGLSFSGDRFFYRNPLASRGEIHRKEWYNCACCPPNLLRYIASIGGRIYATGKQSLYVNLYISSVAEVSVGGRKLKVRMETKYPWEGKVELVLFPGEAMDFRLCLRIPDWAPWEWVKSLRINGEKVSSYILSGSMLCIERKWAEGDRVEFGCKILPRRVYADKRVWWDAGRAALMYGPLVYCLEACDNGGRARNIVLPREASLEARWDGGLLGGIVTIRSEGTRLLKGGGTGKAKLLAVPYHLWDNRAPGEMEVWIPEDPSLAEVPGEKGARLFFRGRVIKASHVYPGDRLDSICDGIVPKTSGDLSVPRFTWWPEKGGKQWVEYVFPEKRKISVSRVFWFDDGPSGGCRVPKSYEILWFDNGGWKAVEPLEGGIPAPKRDVFQLMRFKRVETARIRLVVEMEKGFSAGILEWRVQNLK